MFLPSLHTLFIGKAFLIRDKDKTGLAANGVGCLLYRKNGRNKGGKKII